MQVVFDLDGTLADLTHRLHFIDKKQSRPDWDAFHKACVFDEPINRVIQVFWAMQDAGHTVEIWSGRSDAVRKETEEWLVRHRLYPSALLMRSAGDFTPDDQLKESWIGAIGAPVPDLVFDDRDRVVKMWRKRGITCFQVAPGEF